MAERLATPPELAEYLAVSVDTLRQWAHRHKGPPYVMVEGARRYRWNEVQEWLEARTVRR